MTTIERIKNYINKEDLSNKRYVMHLDELFAIRDNNAIFTALSLAFNYGRAKGLREARAEARK